MSHSGFLGTLSRVGFDCGTVGVGLYITFVGGVGDERLPDGVSVETDPATGDVHLLAGPHYRGIQFHAESILTENGFALLHGLVRDLLV